MTLLLVLANVGAAVDCKMVGAGTNYQEPPTALVYRDFVAQCDRLRKWPKDNRVVERFGGVCSDNGIAKRAGRIASAVAGVVGLVYGLGSGGCIEGE